MQEPTVKINGVPLDLSATPDKSITLEQYKAATSNTQGWRALIPKLNNEALAACVENNMNNALLTVDRCSPTYESTLKYNLVPELLKRLGAPEERGLQEFFYKVTDLEGMEITSGYVMQTDSEGAELFARNITSSFGSRAVSVYDV